MVRLRCRPVLERSAADPKNLSHTYHRLEARQQVGNTIQSSWTEDLVVRKLAPDNIVPQSK
jgi:hypothetical protein